MKCTFHGSLRHQLRVVVQKGNVHVRHAPPRNITVSSHVRADRIAPQFFPFLSKLSQVSCSDGGRVTPSTRAYFLRWQESYSLRSGIPDLAGTLDTMPVIFAKMGLRPSFKLQYGLYGWCSFSPGRILNDIGQNTTPVSIP